MSGTLPQPQTSRWQPLRCGLLNLFYYDYQEFFFSSGRLLLRGGNGTGKSRVLALTLPFLFDGEVSSSRLEPDGDSAKRLSWNLLLDKHEDRAGYTYLELGRLDHGQPRFLTLGCYLKAVKGRPRVSRAFFITDQRVGEELHLLSGRFVLGKDRLKEAVAGRGQTFETAREYRKAVDNQLFRLGEDRYSALMDLLIQLRQPQLSRNLDEKKLSEALTQSLPPLPRNLVEDVAESFKSLDDERAQFENLKRSLDHVRRFLKDYVDYVRIAAKRRAGRIRRAQTEVDDAQGARRDNVGRGEELRESLRAVTEELEQCELKREGEEARLQVLMEGPEANTASELARAETDFQQARRYRDTCQRSCEEVERAATEADQSWERSVEAKKSAESELLQAQNKLADAQQEAALPRECTDIEAARTDLRQRFESLKLLKQLAKQRDSQAGELKRAKERLDTLEAELGDALETQQELSKEKSELLDDFLNCVRLWVDWCTVLDWQPSAEQLEAFQEWAESCEGTQPLTQPLEALVASVRDELITERAESENRRKELDERKTDLEEERERLQSGVHQPPPSPHTRAEDAREGRAGAPFWRLVEFEEHLSEKERAGLEAALESAGILDAWVEPQARSLTISRWDTELQTEGQRHDPLVVHLGQFLKVDNPEYEAVLSPVLQQIGLDEGEHWVSTDGHWGLGSLRGAWNKQAAMHIGQSARERAREARLQEIAGELSLLNGEMEGLQERLTQLTEALTRLQEEQNALPATRDLVRVHDKLEHQAGVVDQVRANLAEQQTKVVRQRDLLDEAEQNLKLAASDCGLSGWIGRLERLEELSRLCERLTDALPSHLDKVLTLEGHVLEKMQLKEEAQARLQNARENLALAREDLVRKEERFHTLKETVGARVEEFHEKVSQAKKALKDCRVRYQSLRDGRGKLEVEQARVEERLEAIELRLTQAEGVRERAVAGMQNLVASGTLPLLDHHPETELSVTQALELARALHRQLESVEDSDDVWNRRDNRIVERSGRFREDLSHHNLDVLTERFDELNVFKVSIDGREYPLSELRDYLEESVERQERLLSAKDQEILENHLIRDVSIKLHELLNEAERWVEEINDELSERQTSRGMKLRFRWLPGREQSPDFEQVRKILMRTSGTWSTEQRRVLGQFLRERIRAAQEEEPEKVWRQHLETAFDYRQWHTFVIERKIQQSPWKRLTKKTHGTGSGGEKALALTIPQFAAAAAFYRSCPDAPRFIMLDEVFVGIDKNMRKELMELLTTFDLDFVMTSEREWGCYSTLPHLAIYQLHTGEEGSIAVSRWEWKGNQRVRVDNVHPMREAVN
jgi:uncharacterized protein (TIGR02680 family)